MPLLAAFIAFALVAFAQDFKTGEAIEYKDGSTWEPGVFLRILPGGTQALIRKKPSQFFPGGSESAFGLADLRKRQQPQPTAASTPKPEPVASAPTTGARGGLLGKEELIAFAKQQMGNDPWANPAREATLDRIRDYIRERGTSFQPDLDFSNRMGAQGTHSVHITSAVSANYGPPPGPNSYFGTWLLRAASRGSKSYTSSGGRPVVQTTDAQAESGQLTIDPNGTYTWQVLRGQSNVLRGKWRWVQPSEMHLWEGGPAIWLLNAKQGYDYMVRGGREPGYADWIDVGAGKGRTPVEYGRRP